MEPTDRLALRIQTSQRLDGVGNAETLVQSHHSSFAGAESHVMMIRGFTSYLGTGAPENVLLQVVTPSSMEAEPSALEQPSSISHTRTPLVWNVAVVFTPDHLPSSQDMEVVATYTSSSGEFRTQSCSIRAPLCLFGKVVQPVKNSVKTRYARDEPPSPPDLGAIRGRHPTVSVQR